MAESDNVFEDLSGVSDDKSDNPYASLLKICNDDQADIQTRYNLHRNTRNEQQKARILSCNFAGVMIDPILEKLANPSKFPEYCDSRHCLVFWARPTCQIRSLISDIQTRLKEFAPSLWLMPLNNLHMTTLEVAHSLTQPDIDNLQNSIRPQIAAMTDYTLNHRARLVKPMLSYDASALALSFLPAAGEGSSTHDDSYTYHHLRRDLYELSRSTGIDMASRYTVPSSHITVARFVDSTDFTTKNRKDPDPERMKGWIMLLENINAWLRAEYWPKIDGSIKEGGEWIVGQEKGLHCRRGTLWYGGGEDVYLGRGF